MERKDCKAGRRLQDGEEKERLQSKEEKERLHGGGRVGGPNYVIGM
jgi:hypothetical protein